MSINCDMVMSSETHWNLDLLPSVAGCKIISNPNFPETSYHGGLAGYIKENLFKYKNNIRNSKCSLSFGLSSLPNCCYMLLYTYHVDSKNYNEADFGILAEELLFWMSRGYTVYVGGDFNAHLGDLNILSKKIFHWRYDENIDKINNSHRKNLMNVCEQNDISPLNHCHHYHNIRDGRFTYYKAGEQSQIDFCFTNRNGRKFVSNFQIIDTKWHLSDHLPLLLSLPLPYVIYVNMLYTRAYDLFGEVSSMVQIKSYKFEFDFNNAKIHLEEKIQQLLDIAAKSTHEQVLLALAINLISLLKINKMEKKRVNNVNTTNCAVGECDLLYKRYSELKQGRHDFDLTHSAYESYQSARIKLNMRTFHQHQMRYQEMLLYPDDRKLWNEIDWSGKYKSEKTL